MQLHADKNAEARLLLDKVTEMMKVHMAIAPMLQAKYPRFLSWPLPSLVNSIKTKFNSERKNYRVWKTITAKSGVTFDHATGLVFCDDEWKTECIRIHGRGIAFLFTKGFVDLAIYEAIFEAELGTGQDIQRPDALYTAFAGTREEGGRALVTSLPSGEDLLPISDDDDGNGEEEGREEAGRDEDGREEEGRDEEGREEGREGRGRERSRRQSVRSRTVVGSTPTSAPSQPSSVAPSQRSSVAIEISDDEESVSNRRLPLIKTRTGKPPTAVDSMFDLGRSLKAAAKTLAATQQQVGAADVERAIRDIEKVFGAGSAQPLPLERKISLQMKMSEVSGGLSLAVTWNAMPDIASKQVLIRRWLGEE